MNHQREMNGSFAGGYLLSARQPHSPRRPAQLVAFDLHHGRLLVDDESVAVVAQPRKAEIGRAEEQVLHKWAVGARYPRQRAVPCNAIHVFGEGFFQPNFAVFGCENRVPFGLEIIL